MVQLITSFGIDLMMSFKVMFSGRGFGIPFGYVLKFNSRCCPIYSKVAIPTCVPTTKCTTRKQEGSGFNLINLYPDLPILTSEEKNTKSKKRITN